MVFPLTAIQRSGNLMGVKQLIVRIPDDLHKKLKLHSVMAEKDMAIIVRELLEEYFAKLEKKKPKK
jgi:predicted DNA-binding protein